MSRLLFLGFIAISGLIGLFLLAQQAPVTGDFVTGIHMGTPSKNVKLSKKLIEGKEVTQAIIVPDKPIPKSACKPPQCWYDDRYTDAQGTVRITGTRDDKGVNMQLCHSENSLRTVRVKNEKECFTQKIYCKPNGTWGTWQNPVACPGTKKK